MPRPPRRTWTRSRSPRTRKPSSSSPTSSSTATARLVLGLLGRLRGGLRGGLFLGAAVAGPRAVRRALAGIAGTRRGARIPCARLGAGRGRRLGLDGLLPRLGGIVGDVPAAALEDERSRREQATHRPAA